LKALVLWDGWYKGSDQSVANMMLVENVQQRYDIHQREPYDYCQREPYDYCQREFYDY
jgi:hypothetical protein